MNLPDHISINVISAPQALAEAIEGFRPNGLVLSDPDVGGEPIVIDGRERVVQFRDFLELQFSNAAHVRTARVTIERPRQSVRGSIEDARVSWSSGGQDDKASARATSRLLEFAVRVAEHLDAWAAAGQLPRLSVDEQTAEPTTLPAAAQVPGDGSLPESYRRSAEALARRTGIELTGETARERSARIEAQAANDAAIERAREVRTLEPRVGDLVDVAIYAPGPGGSSERPVGHLRGYVTVAAGEFNVGLIDDEEDVADTLDRADVNADDLPLADGSGSVPLGTPILENCQREWLTVIERPEATR